MSAYILQVYEPAERSAVQMNPVTDLAQACGGDLKTRSTARESTLQGLNE